MLATGEALSLRLFSVQVPPDAAIGRRNPAFDSPSSPVCLRRVVVRRARWAKLRYAVLQGIQGLFLPEIG